jgi:hypothetical protein
MSTHHCFSCSNNSVAESDGVAANSSSVKPYVCIEVGGASVAAATGDDGDDGASLVGAFGDWGCVGGPHGQVAASATATSASVVPTGKSRLTRPLQLRLRLRLAQIAVANRLRVRVHGFSAKYLALICAIATQSVICKSDASRGELHFSVEEMTIVHLSPPLPTPSPLELKNRCL